MDSLSTFVEYTDDGTVVIPAGPIGQFQEWIACTLAEPITEVIICTFVILNCMVVALSTLSSLQMYDTLFENIERTFGIIFTIEIIGRWWSSSANRFQYIFNAQFIIDAVVILVPMFFDVIPTPIIKEYVPPWLITPSTLVNLKLLRVLRLRRVLQDKTTFSKFEVALGLHKTSDFTRVKDWQLRLARVLLSLFTLLSIASGMIYSAEHEVNPAFSDYFTTLYFGLTTLTTVGFGDLVPITWQGRVIVAGSILAGIAIVPAQAAALIEALLARQNNDSSLSYSKTSSIVSSSNFDADNLMDHRRTVMDNEMMMKHNNDMGNILHDANDNYVSLDNAGRCRSCQQTMHWSHAKFCWSCGHPLR
jgi:voltage-gated potassium channel